MKEIIKKRFTYILNRRWYPKLSQLYIECILACIFFWDSSLSWTYCIGPYAYIRVPTAQGNRGNGPENYCPGKHGEFENFAKTQGILGAQSVNSLILEVKDIIWNYFFEAGYIWLFFVCSSCNLLGLAQGKFAVRQGKHREFNNTNWVKTLIYKSEMKVNAQSPYTKLFSWKERMPNENRWKCEMSRFLCNGLAVVGQHFLFFTVFTWKGITLRDLDPIRDTNSFPKAAHIWENIVLLSIKII